MQQPELQLGLLPAVTHAPCKSLEGWRGLLPGSLRAALEGGGTVVVINHVWLIVPGQFGGALMAR